MASNGKTIEEHVGALLSGYIDGELTQQQRQRVDIHCDACAECRQMREELAALRNRVGEARLSEYGEDKWREMMGDTTVRVSSGIGWLMVIGGFLALAAIGVFVFLTDPGIEWHMKVIMVAIYGGMAALFISVLRQRLIERKSDKYKDVEI